MVFTWSNRKKGDILFSHHELSVPYGGENGLTNLEFPKNPLHDPLLILTPYTQNKKPRILKYLSAFIIRKDIHNLGRFEDFEFCLNMYIFFECKSNCKVCLRNTIFTSELKIIIKAIKTSKKDIC